MWSPTMTSHIQQQCHARMQRGDVVADDDQPHISAVSRRMQRGDVVADDDQPHISAVSRRMQRGDVAACSREGKCAKNYNK